MEVEMKLFIVLAFAAVFFSKTASAQEVQVPGVGSIWESTSVYAPSAEDGKPPRKDREIFKVDRMQDGRPVFAGKMFGFEGEIIESTEGTIVYELACKNDVPANMLVPPVSPNQCVNHVCSAPGVEDKPLVRPTFIYVQLFGCQKQEGEYTFTSVGTQQYDGGMVTVGEVKFTFNGAPRAAWKSYIKKGVGQVFAESLTKVTTYNKVEVLLVPYEQSAPFEKSAIAPAK
jgi:hypothetical protein